MLLALWIILALILALLLWILFAPIIIYMNTERHVYFFHMVGFLKVQPLWNDGGLRLGISLPVHRFEIDLLKKRKKKKKAKPKEREKSKKGWKAVKPTKDRILAVIKSFKIKQFKLSLDTGDYVTNALLVPAFYAANAKGIQATINFQGESHILLEISNTVWTIGRAYLTPRKRQINL